MVFFNKAYQSCSSSNIKKKGSASSKEALFDMSSIVPYFSWT